MGFGIFNSAVRDAKKIHDAIDYRILRAAWDTYVRIKRNDFHHIHKTATPAWFALFSIINYNGNFRKFEPDELHLLESFITVPHTYEEITAALSQHIYTTSFFEYMLATHPNLQEAIPKDLYTKEKMGKYIIDMVEQYRVLLQQYYKKHKSQIDTTIAYLQKQSVGQH